MQADNLQEKLCMVGLKHTASTPSLLPLFNSHSLSQPPPSCPRPPPGSASQGATCHGACLAPFILTLSRRHSERSGLERGEPALTAPPYQPSPPRCGQIMESPLCYAAGLMLCLRSEADFAFLRQKNKDASVSSVK
ncbi:hypothetical protein KOW79_005436 [Hemibagrus wyckioides]|uniref:Uncharacterized protein n=1 Tax=Hemibagrus wyckioides TaxID=337641 RepID=A0A9D3NZI9_9TELE|nr:hypothetical protein KOW79_005436 [Hemibagrus wyckioides]